VRLVALTVVVLAALAGLGSAVLGGEPQRRPAVAPAPPDRVPLLGIVHGSDDPGSLVRLRPRTLRPASRPIRLRGFSWGTAWSPDRRRLAVAVADVVEGRIERSGIQIVDVRRWRTAAVIPVSPHTEVQQMAWTAPHRLLAVLGARAGTHRIAVVDPAARRVVRQGRLAGLVPGDAIRPTGDGLAAIVAPARGIGPASLALVSHEGDVRRVPLPGLEAGFHHPPLDPNAGAPFPAGRQRVPALAVDAAARRAYVADAGSPAVVEVDLASGAATRREPVERRTLLQRLRDLVEPPAEAKGVTGPWSQAQVLGGGWLAVSGWDDTIRGDHQERRPHGLRLIDTREWTAETVDERVSSFVLAHGTLLVADGGYGRNSGVVALNPDGTRRFRLLGGRDAGAAIAGGLLYATPYGPSRTHVVDLRTGRTVGVLPRGEMPALIPEPLS